MLTQSFGRRGALLINWFASRVVVIQLTTTAPLNKRLMIDHNAWIPGCEAVEIS